MALILHRFGGMYEYLKALQKPLKPKQTTELNFCLAVLSCGPLISSLKVRPVEHAIVYCWVNSSLIEEETSAV